MDGTVVAFFVPTVLFLCIVAPTWIFMHYRSKQKAQGSLSEQEIVELETLANHAERMGDRIETPPWTTSLPWCSPFPGAAPISPCWSRIHPRWCE